MIHTTIIFIFYYLLLTILSIISSSHFIDHNNNNHGHSSHAPPLTSQKRTTTHMMDNSQSIAAYLRHRKTYKQFATPDSLKSQITLDHTNRQSVPTSTTTPYKQHLSVSTSTVTSYTEHLSVPTSTKVKLTRNHKNNLPSYPHRDKSVPSHPHRENSVTSNPHDWKHRNDIPHIDLRDQTWSRYVDLVYGDNASIHHSHLLQKNYKDFQFYYLNAGVKILSLNSIHESYPVNLPSSRFVLKEGGKPTHYQPYQWVEVMRFKVNSIYREFSNEGLFAPNWTNVPRYKYINPTKVPYGCWFWAAPGSGIYINVGNVLVIPGKKKTMGQMFKGYLNDKSCIKGDNAKNCYDKYFCMAALSQGKIALSYWMLTSHNAYSL